jgi:4-hydroxymandelate oxidase
MYALAVGGEEGVKRALEILRDELSRAMALTGRPTIASIDRSLVAMYP